MQQSWRTRRPRCHHLLAHRREPPTGVVPGRRLIAAHGAGSRLASSTGCSTSSSKATRTLVQNCRCSTSPCARPLIMVHLFYYLPLACHHPLECSTCQQHHPFHANPSPRCSRLSSRTRVCGRIGNWYPLSRVRGSSAPKEARVCARSDRKLQLVCGQRESPGWGHPLHPIPTVRQKRQPLRLACLWAISACHRFPLPVATGRGTGG